MSLYGVMRTGASGMNAQATRLSTVADNVANVNTTGYKAASCEFSSLLLSTDRTMYECGSVLTKIRNHIDEQGGLTSTNSYSDLAISGEGFFLVSDATGEPLLTRAGAFVPNGAGDFINSAGYKLLGYRVNPESPPITADGINNLVPVNLAALALSAAASTEGTLKVNVPSAAPVVAAANLPSVNSTSSEFTAKSSLITYDSLGAEVKLDIYFAKTAASTWQVTVFDGRTAAAGGGFPYGTAALATDTLSFTSTGVLDPSELGELSFTIPGGAPFTLDISGTTQLATNYTLITSSVNGSPAGRPSIAEITTDGYVYAVYDSGARFPMFRIPLGQVTSPDMLLPMSGNVFGLSVAAGNLEVGFPDSNGLGKVLSATLEQSTVDLAGELTTMIDAQRSYTANSKVFQTGAELMDVLVNLKR